MLVSIPMLDHRVIVGFHGCDQETSDRVLATGEPLRPSRNRWDWLGEGVYFWEQSIERAWEFAEEQRLRGKVRTPSVVGAFIHLGRCFDLTRRAATEALRAVHADYASVIERAGLPMPVNRAAAPGDHDLLLRDLDCAVLNFHLRETDRAQGAGGCFYQTVRGVFVEGEPAFPGAGIFLKTHVQIAVRDPSTVIGYFRPSRYTPEGG